MRLNLIAMVFRSKWNILNGKEVDIEISELNIVTMWLIPLIVSHIAFSVGCFTHDTG